MKTQRRRNRLANIAFFLPVVVIIGLVVFGYFYATRPGTLDVAAWAQNKYLSEPEQSTPIHVSAMVGSTSGTTPFSLSLPAGQYEVTYPAIPWYYTPSSNEVAVTNGRTVYSTGAYDVIVKIIALSSAGFNATTVSALHGVTPVIWINTSGSNLELEVSGQGNYILSPDQNFTAIFSSPGTYQFATPSGSSTSTSGIITVE